MASKETRSKSNVKLKKYLFQTIRYFQENLILQLGSETNLMLTKLDLREANLKVGGSFNTKK